MILQPPLDRPLTDPISRQERTIGCAVNLAAIPFPYLGPLVGWMLSRSSTFVRFQCARALIEQVVFVMVAATITAGSIGWSIVKLIQTGGDFSNFDWKAALLKSVLFALVLVGLSLANLINGIIDAVQANRGELPRKMKWTERLAAKVVGLQTPQQPSTK